MSQADELDPAYQGPVDAAVANGISKRSLDWAVIVVAFAFGCTLAWISLLLWVVVRVLQVILT